jgi:heterodisulfide reductase subunit C
MERITIDSRLDTAFKYDIAKRPGGENIKKCFACGTCTAGCPAFHADHEYNPRKIIRMILLGMREEVLRSPAIWLCHQCYACSANCPQDVDFSHIMMAIREIAVEAGYHPKDRLEKVEEITLLANEFRRDCIKLLGGEDLSDEEILSRVRNTVEVARGTGGSTNLAAEGRDSE